MIQAIEKVLYTSSTHVTGGRNGSAHSSDGRLETKLSSPGGPGNGTNPEQLFGAGWSACFLGAIGHAAAARQIKVPADAAVDAEIDLGTNTGGYQLEARLKVSLPGIDRALGKELIEAAHQICPYSKATRGNINVELILA